jgi:predicted signal transduction protein with EAL and GGDEF domain
MRVSGRFVRDPGQENDSVAIIRAALQVGSSLAITTAAEGVETEERLEIQPAGSGGGRLRHGGNYSHASDVTEFLMGTSIRT